MNGSFLLLQHSKSLLNAFLLWIAPFALGFLLYFSLPTTYSSPLKVALFHFNKEALVDATSRAVIQDYQETWQKIFSYSPLLKKEKVDLIVLPEGIVPYSSNIALMEREEIPKEIIQSILTDSSYLSSKEISQALSDYWNSALLIGMERKATAPEATYYNTCFLFTPKRRFTFYDKQVLVPGGEYVPLESFFKPILLQYGVIGSFEQGRGPVLLHTPKVTLFPLICYEETLSQYMLPAIPLKADLLVSISNDHWFPSPLFAREHWLLGKMRAMEIGMSLLRSSNLGKSGLILPNGTEPISNKMQKQEELLIFSFVPEKRKTPFSSLQETTILCILFLIPLCFSVFNRIRSKK
jgi:apolipoprotein N-acyltransferase